MTDSNNYISEVFFTSKAAEQAYLYALQCGYVDKEINIIMSEESRKKHYGSFLTNTTSTLEDVAKGGVLGGAVGGGLGAIIALGVSVFISGIGFIVAGPLAGAVVGTLMGTLLALGVSEANAQSYAEAIKSGAILLSVPDKGIGDLKSEWLDIKQRNEKE